MPRGRRPQPAAIKRAKGNPGRRPIVESAVLPTDLGLAIAQPPKELTKDQRAVWTKFAPDLERLKLLKTTDVGAFQRYCVLLPKFYAAEQKLRKNDLVVRTTSEHVDMDRMNKWLQVMLLLDKRLLEIEDRFGMNPQARQRIMLAMAAHQPQLPGTVQPKTRSDTTGDDDFLPGAMPPPSPIGFLNKLN